MKPMKLRTRLFVSLVALTLLVTVSAFSAFYDELRETMLQTLDQNLRARARRLARGRVEPRELAVDALGTGYRGWISYDPSGEEVLAHSAGSEPPSLPAWIRQEALEHPRKGVSKTVTLASGDTLRVHAAVFRLASGGDERRPATLVAVFESMARIEHELGELTTRFLQTAPLAVGLALLLAWIMARALTRPLRRMAKAAGATDGSDASGDVPGSGAGDELDDLAHALNRAFGRLRGALERQQRFTADAAHELRTPVSAIRSRTEVALRRARTDEEYRLALRDAFEAACHAGETVEGLLLLARLDGADDEPRAELDLGGIVTDEVAAARSRHELSAERLRWEAPESPVTVRGNGALLAVVVRNAIENAATHGASEAGVSVGLTVRGARAVLTVRDAGRGIPADHTGAVFERFHQVEASRAGVGGAGLGLAIVREVATHHGGQAEIVSAPGAGTTLTITLPLA